jgi:hypothetical protein
MNYKTILFIILMYGCSLCTAQQSISTSGGEASGTGGAVSYTVGQVAYTTNTGNEGTINQ